MFYGFVFQVLRGPSFKIFNTMEVNVTFAVLAALKKIHQNTFSKVEALSIKEVVFSENF